jgi:hypothetical protein
MKIMMYQKYVQVFDDDDISKQLDLQALNH